MEDIISYLWDHLSVYSSPASVLPSECHLLGTCSITDIQEVILESVLPHTEAKRSDTFCLSPLGHWGVGRDVSLAKYFHFLPLILNSWCKNERNIDVKIYCHSVVWMSSGVFGCSSFFLAHWRALSFCAFSSPVLQSLFYSLSCTLIHIHNLIINSLLLKLTRIDFCILPRTTTTTSCLISPGGSYSQNQQQKVNLH